MLVCSHGLASGLGLVAGYLDSVKGRKVFEAYLGRAVRHCFSASPHASTLPGDGRHLYVSVQNDGFVENLIDATLTQTLCESLQRPI